MKNAIQLRGVEGFKVEISDQLRLAKKEALEAASIIKTVYSEMALQAASDAMVGLSRVVKVTESSRKDAKSPVIEWGKQIDAEAKSFVDEPESEIVRLKLLIGPYEESKRKAYAEAEEKRQAEIRRLEEENRKVQAEAAKLIREAQEASAKSANEADKKRADELAAKLKAEADKKDAEYEDSLRAKPIQATKTEGLVGKEVIKFQVWDIELLAKTHPYLVKMEVNVSAMNVFLKSGQPVPASIKAWKEFDVNARG